MEVGITGKEVEHGSHLSLCTIRRSYESFPMSQVAAKLH